MPKRKRPKLSAAREKFERLTITDTDLVHAARFLKEYVDHNYASLDGSIVADALTLSIVVTYSRPFTQVKNRRGGTEAFDSSFLTAPLSPPQLGLHTRILADRKHLYAHSDAAAKSIALFESDDGPITTSYDFVPMEQRDAEALAAIISLMRDTLRSELQALLATIPPDQVRTPCAHCGGSFYTMEYAPPQEDNPHLTNLCNDCRHCDAVGRARLADLTAAPTS